MKHFASIILALALALPTFAEDGFKWCIYTFGYTESGMKPYTEAQLQELSEFIKCYPDSMFEVSAHTDERQREEFSIKLCDNRAKWVKQYLIDNFNIPDSMLVSVGKIANEPYIRGAKTEAEHELNRRVEIRITRLP